MVSENTHLYRDTLKLHGKQSKEGVVKCFQNADERKKIPKQQQVLLHISIKKKKSELIQSV